MARFAMLKIRNFLLNRHNLTFVSRSCSSSLTMHSKSNSWCAINFHFGKQFSIYAKKYTSKTLTENIQPEHAEDKALQQDFLDSKKSLRRGPIEPFEELLINDESNQVKSVTNQDAAEFIDDIAPPSPVSFNLAGFVNDSNTLQQLVNLGVDLSHIEKKAERAKYIVRLDFEKDMKNHIQFLYDNGVPADSLGNLITKNPFIFKVNIEDLQIRVNYLKSKKFSNDAIARIIAKNPYFLSNGTKTVDSRLGFFQKTFKLTGDEVRFLITKRPQLITYEYEKIREKIFVIKEEMAFSADEMKNLLLMKPKVWMLGRKSLTERFQIVHNIMGISQKDILKFPGVLLKRGFLLKQRHQYLTHLGRAQYDPTKPGYVSLLDISSTTDHAFCKICAKTSTDAYNDFLKTL